MFLQELKFWLKTPSIYIYSIIFFLLGMTVMSENAGIWLDAPDGSIANTPIEIFIKINWFNRLIVLLLPSILGVAVYRDVKSNIHSLLYVYPFSKMKYLLSKFISAFLVLLVILSMVGIGIWAGTQLPNVQSEMLIDFDIMPYLVTYFVFIIPNVLLLGAIVFGVVALTRNIYSGFVVVILLFVFQLLVGSLTGGVENAYWASLLDPMGDTAMQYTMRYWTPMEYRQNALPLDNLIIYNRLIWLGIAFLVFVFTYLKFEFSQLPATDLFNFNQIIGRFFKQKEKNNAKKSGIQLGYITKIELPKVAYQFSFLSQIKRTWTLSNAEFRYIITHRMFIILLVSGTLAIFFQLANIQMTRGFEILPTTWKMLSLPMVMFSGIINILTFLYAGMLVQRGKMAEMNQLIDTTSIPNWSLFGAKFIALLKMQWALLTVVMIAGIAAQLFNGYTRLELWQYGFSLYVLHFINFAIWGMVAIFIQTVFTNAYLGLFLLIGGSMGMAVLSQFGVEPPVFRYNMGPSFGYSDLDGYGSSLKPYLIYKIYWSLFGGFLLLGTLAFWSRGISFSFLERFKMALRRSKGRIGMAMILFLIAFGSLGFKIYYESYMVNGVMLSAKEERKAYTDFQKEYQHLAKTKQPKIVSVKTSVDIFPYKNRFKATGMYILVNKTTQPIDTLMIRTGFDEVTTFEIGQPAEAIAIEKEMHFEVWKLEKALQPNDSLELTFEIQSPKNHLFTTYHNVKKNGSFIKSDAYPRIGFLNIGQKGLPSDSLMTSISYTSADVDWIDFEARVSTSSDQIGLSVGYLEKEWTEGNRNYFSYKMDRPIKFFFGFNSGRFEVLRDSLEGVSLEIYYDKKHPYNLDRMMKGLKETLTFCNENYSKYQHQQARIIEYPMSLGSSSTTFANSIPFAEYNFVADIRAAEGDIDVPYYVAAHELAHQWWGNQVIPADVQGARMLTESLAEYTALKVLERTYGTAPMRQFLKLNLDNYLRNKKTAWHAEKSLMLADANQEYITYRKGALVFYALSDYLSEARFNGILKKFIEQVDFRIPYPTSLELVNLIKKELPDSLQYLAKDMFETITLYDNSTSEATVKALANGKYEVKMNFMVSKYRLVGTGQRIYTENGDSLLYQSTDLVHDIQSLPLADYIDIGVFDANGKLLYLKKHRITEIDNTITVLVDEKPYEVGIDPLNKLIDRKSTDNLKVFTF
jgi:ABC-2 type transport system permease protein